MESKQNLNIKVKMENAETSNAFCQGCLTNENLHYMFRNYFNKKYEEVELYGEMLFSCFSIQVDRDSADERKKYFICTKCILKLKDAFRFKLQVEYTQAVLQEMSKLQDSQEETHDDFSAECDNIEADCDDWPESTNSYEINDNKSLECENDSEAKKSTSIIKQTKKNNVVRGSKESLMMSKLKEKKRGMAHLPYVPDDSELQCRICNKIFYYNLALKKHLNTHAQNFFCEKCGKAFSKESSLHTHVLAKHESKIYTCPLCPRTYTTYDSFSFHQRSHITKMQYRCPICSERFHSYSTRLAHLHNKHDIAKTIFKCSECPKEYSHNTSLFAHIRRSHLKQRKHICKVCGLSFFENKSLCNHMLRHTGEKNFECLICHKRYGRKYTLVEHMKIHNNVKRFICAICDKAFTQKCTLKGHMQVHLKQKE